KRWIIL
nr:Chain F, 6-mer peptide [Human immunodeficiency virus 1]6VQZ_G Chain G, 6-mer peptide [Human immunodeficiency virus 1]